MMDVIRQSLIYGACIALGGFATNQPGWAEEVEVLPQSRGMVIAKSRATISSELVAPVVRTPFDAGEEFRKGDVLVEFDCRRFNADVRAYEAKLRAQEGVYKANSILARNKAVGATELYTSKAQLDQVKAELEVARLRQSSCKIVAPYDGRIVDVLINPFETPQANKPLLSIVDHKHLTIELLVPSAWLSWLKAGLSFHFDIDETAQRYAARILRIGSTVDPISQTVKIIAVFQVQPDGILPGMSGSAAFANGTGEKTTEGNSAVRGGN